MNSSFVIGWQSWCHQRNSLFICLLIDWLIDWLPQLYVCVCRVSLERELDSPVQSADRPETWRHNRRRFISPHHALSRALGTELVPLVDMLDQLENSSERLCFTSKHVWLKKTFQCVSWVNASIYWNIHMHIYELLCVIWSCSNQSRWNRGDM